MYLDPNCFWKKLTVFIQTKDRSYEELDILFGARIGAWKFRKTVVDAYAPEGQRIKQE